MFTADQVWALAVIADRINGGYLKEPVYSRNLDVVEKQPNKVMVKQWLRDGAFAQITDADIEQGRVVRHYFNGFILKELSGRINDFERTALRIAQKEQFTTRDLLDFAVVSCLPSTMIRDQQRKEITRDIMGSTQLAGAVGDRIQGELEEVGSRYSKEYNKYRITGRMGESYVDFWFTKDLTGFVGIKGRIKALRGDKTTQLNFVKTTT